MGLFELFELCAQATAPPADKRASPTAAGRGVEGEDGRHSTAQLFWAALVSSVLACIGLLQGLAAS